MGRTIGLLLIGAGVVIGLLVTLFLGVNLAQGELTAGGAALGFGIGVIVVCLPLIGAGIFFLWKGRSEQAAIARRQQQRKILDMVKTRGQIAVSDLSIELGQEREKTRDMIYTLVGMGLFSGYINWDEGVLYSAQASNLRELTNCNVCTGQLELAGKGVIRCPFCGTEYFLE